MRKIMPKRVLANGCWLICALLFSLEWAGTRASEPSHVASELELPSMFAPPADVAGDGMPHQKSPPTAYNEVLADVPQELDVWSLDKACVPVLMGSGFRPFVRGLAGGIHWRNDFPTEIIDSATYTGAEEMRFGSVELARQHVWSDRPSAPGPGDWRIAIFDRYFALDAGWLPLAEQGEALFDDIPKQGWFKSFHSASYVSYGVRVNYGRDDMEIYVENINVPGTLNDFFVHNSVDHVSIGPQLVYGRTSTRRRWTIDRSIRIMLGAGRADFEQSSGFVNDVELLRTGDTSVQFDQVVDHEKDASDFYQHAELRIVSSYAIQKNWTIDVLGRAVWTGPWYRAGRQIDFSQSDFGFRDEDNDHWTYFLLNVGLTYLH